VEAAAGALKLRFFDVPGVSCDKEWMQHLSCLVGSCTVSLSWGIVLRDLIVDPAGKRLLEASRLILRLLARFVVGGGEAQDPSFRCE
jgi:hypothetical protein